MKNTVRTLAILTLGAVSFTACKKEKVEVPQPVEQELITTLKLKVTDGAGFDTTFIYKVENGFGSNTQGTIVKDDVALSANKTYNVTLQVLNEKENPVEDITEEIIEEKNEHLFVYQSNPATGNGAISFADGNKDGNGNPFNQAIKFSTGNAGNGEITITLKHEPTNKSATTPEATGGETDLEASFKVVLK